MDLDLSRKGGIFWRKKDVDWKSLDNQKVANLWVDDEIPQAYMNIKGMMSREEQTVQQGLTELKWMFTKSADQIEREKLEKAKEVHTKAEADKRPSLEAIDWSTENKTSPFTFDIMQMGNCRKMLKTGLTMIHEKIEA